MVWAGVVMSSRYSASVGTRLCSAAALGLHEYSADIMMESESVPAESNSAAGAETGLRPLLACNKVTKDRQQHVRRYCDREY